MNDIKPIISKYFPLESSDSIVEIIEKEKIQLIITKKRKTKIGDYRPPTSKINFHRISINQDLPPDLFLLIFLHEYAHLLTWKVFKNKAFPHGEEWKMNYVNLIISFIKKGFFSKETAKIILRNIENPVRAENAIVRDIIKSNEIEEGYFYVEQLSPKTKFITVNGLKFQMIEKLRKRYKCLCLNNNKLYLFQPFVRVRLLID